MFTKIAKRTFFPALFEVPQRVSEVEAMFPQISHIAIDTLCSA